MNEKVNELIRHAVNLILQKDNFAIKAKQNAPRPVHAYATVDLVSEAPNGQPDSEITKSISGRSVIENTFLRSFVISLVFYKRRAMENARKTHMGMFRESVQSVLSAGGLGLVRLTDILHLPEPINATWENRAQFDMHLSSVMSDIETVNSIISASIDGEYQGTGEPISMRIEGGYDGYSSVKRGKC